MSDLVPATELNPNAWYHVTEQYVDKDYETKWRSILQMNQDPNVKDDNLHVWPAKTDDGNVSAFWQFQPVTSTPGRYMLRYSQTGVDVQLSVCLHSDVDDNDTKTRPCLRNATDHESQQWDIAVFKSNSSYRFINVHNGTGYHMDCMSDGPVFMSPDIDDRPYQSAQHWLMTSASRVDDKAYSTTVSENPSTTSRSSTSTTNAGPKSSDRKGLSSGTVTAIAVGIVLGVIIVAGSLAAYLIWRSKKRKNAATTTLATKRSKNRSDKGSPAPPYRADSPDDAGRSLEPVEMMNRTTGSVAAELPGNQRYELA